VHVFKLDAPDHARVGRPTHSNPCIRSRQLSVPVPNAGKTDRTGRTRPTTAFSATRDPSDTQWLSRDRTRKVSARDRGTLLTTPSSLRLGTVAPNFKAETTKGAIDFHEFVGDNWVVFFSHPEDYTPVCTTELGEFARLEPEFTKRGVKLIGLSANTLGSHEGWIADIQEISGNHLNFPIIADKERKVAFLYDM